MTDALKAPGVIAISGVNRGIGEGVTSAFLGAGWRVHGLGRTAPNWANRYPDAFVFHHCDMADHGAVIAACDAIAEPLDVVLCNAATFGGGAFYCHDFDPACFAEVFAVNVVAPAVMAKALRSRLAEASRRLIVMMSTGNASLSGNTEGTMMAYRASKSALNQLVRNLAAEWGDQGFTTVALNPGWVRTAMGGDAAPMAVEVAAAEILNFVSCVATAVVNGKFVNTDGSALPW